MKTCCSEIEMQNSQILKIAGKVRQVSFCHQSSPVSWKAWTLPWISHVHDCRMRSEKLGVAVYTWGHLIWVLKQVPTFPPNLTAHDWTRKYMTGTFHVDDGLLFFLLCDIVIDHLRKSVVDKHLDSALRKHLANFNSEILEMWFTNKVLFVTKFLVVISQLGMLLCPFNF